MDHDGSKWLLDPVWDKCFPSFKADTMEEAIGKYYNFYYEEAEKYQLKYPDIFRIFPIDDLNTEEGKNSIMDFCGFAQKSRDLADVWIHRIES